MAHVIKDYVKAIVRKRPAPAAKVVRGTTVYGDSGSTASITDTNPVIVAIDTTTGTASTYGTVSGTPDGSLVKFNTSNTSYQTGTAEVYLNGQKQVKGVDWTESDPGTGEVTMTVAPLTGDVLMIAYDVSAAAHSLSFMTSQSGTDVPTFTVTIGGGESTFTLPPYVTGTLRVYEGGQLLTQGTSEDWVETLASAGTVSISREVVVGTVVEVVFQSALSGYIYENTEDNLTYTFNGTNTRGVTSKSYKPGKLVLSWNGQLLTPGTDYVETDPIRGYFDTVSALASGTLQAVYPGGTSSVSRNPRLNVNTITTATTLTPYYAVVLCNAVSAAFTVTLPPAADATGVRYDIKKTDSSANAVTIDGDGSETIDGNLTVLVNLQYESVPVISDGSNWHVL